MKLHTHPSPVPVIESERDDWWRQARCTDVRDRDMWTADDLGVRLAAAHQCIAHCPVLARCHRYAQDHTWTGMAIGGVVYGYDGLPLDLEPGPCLKCDEQGALAYARRRSTWREYKQRVRAAGQQGAA
jgi:hypothetical protein